MLLQRFLRTGRQKKRLPYANRQEIKQNLYKLSCIDASAICRKTDFHPDNDFSAFLIYLTGASFQNFLSRLADSEKSALSGALRLKGKFLNFCCHAPQQVVLKRNPAVLLTVTFPAKPGCLPRHNNAYLRGRGKGVPLHMVYGQDILLKLVFSLCILISGIPLMVYLT